MRQLLIREQCLQREQKQHQDPQPMDEMEKQVMYFTVWAALLFTELKWKIVIFSIVFLRNLLYFLLLFKESRGVSCIKSFSIIFYVLKNRNLYLATFAIC